MTLSREAQILLAVLGVLGLGFGWLQFSSRLDGSTLNAPTTSRERSSAASNTPPVSVPSVATPSVVPGEVQPGTAQGEGAQGGEVDEPRVARELQVAQLPFLISAPPLLNNSVADTTDALDTTTGQVPTVAQSSGQRASVNPFSPLVVAEVETPAETSDAPRPQVVEVPTQPRPQVAAAPTPRRAPVPSARTPGSSALAGSALPRTLPGRTLASTPDILRSVLNAPAVQASTPDNPLLEGDTPLAADATSLTLFLRDREVTFTGAVLGPLSVGIFRSADAPAPFLVPLGQTLPETDIVLTDLTGQQAELTQGDDVQLLTLDRR